MKRSEILVDNYMYVYDKSFSYIKRILNKLLDHVKTIPIYPIIETELQKKTKDDNDNRMCIDHKVNQVVKTGSNIMDAYVTALNKLTNLLNGKNSICNDESYGGQSSQRFINDTNKNQNGNAINSVDDKEELSKFDYDEIVRPTAPISDIISNETRLSVRLKEGKISTWDFIKMIFGKEPRNLSDCIPENLSTYRSRVAKVRLGMGNIFTLYELVWSYLRPIKVKKDVTYYDAKDVRPIRNPHDYVDFICKQYKLDVNVIMSVVQFGKILGSAPLKQMIMNECDKVMKKSREFNGIKDRGLMFYTISSKCKECEWDKICISNTPIIYHYHSTLIKAAVSSDFTDIDEVIYIYSDINKKKYERYDKYVVLGE